MYDCTAIFGRERAQKLWELMREASGTECPCARGGPCIFDGTHQDSNLVEQHRPPRQEGEAGGIRARG
jgi:hypothetical protein